MPQASPLTFSFSGTATLEFPAHSGLQRLHNECKFRTGPWSQDQILTWLRSVRWLFYFLDSFLCLQSIERVIFLDIEHPLWQGCQMLVICNIQTNFQLIFLLMRKTFLWSTGSLIWSLIVLALNVVSFVLCLRIWMPLYFNLMIRQGTTFHLKD